ncbi:hypothetical protein B0H19DRAFT_1062829 [Mycena capillaripes]|nr:hypothetical protein B0H19DRAFT_1062829 [Mycena capillaripes]
MSPSPARRCRRRHSMIDVTANTTSMKATATTIPTTAPVGRRSPHEFSTIANKEAIEIDRVEDPVPSPGAAVTLPTLLVAWRVEVLLDSSNVDGDVGTLKSDKSLPGEILDGTDRTASVTISMAVWVAKNVTDNVLVRTSVTVIAATVSVTGSGRVTANWACATGTEKAASSNESVETCILAPEGIKQQNSMGNDNLCSPVQKKLEMCSRYPA